ncbi:roundabout homolog 1 isoform X1 [Tachysurus fulvidraco]|uniref:roundabout homolog 1 isoform X1 n=1 Tax=Tachysurus fulvidraco TaxID=1234273 RepID=UPI001FF060AC|nr:roundabout homolog 1 isoform X1 [Tachysurus fulvidraco]
MQLSLWLLWLAFLCTCSAHASGHCKCHCTCLPEDQLQVVKRSEKVESKGNYHHRLAHAPPSRRGRGQRRKGSRLRSDEVSPRIVHHPSDVVVRVGSPATLSCRAEGTPEPSIQWLRNGIPLEPEKMEGQSRPIILPEGSLFFLSVVTGKKSQSHEAVYSCLARNSAGSAISRNASLHIAALREEFRMQPADVEVATGEVAVMNCSPPVGHPEPNITWRKDGVLINTTDEHYTELNGKLIIAPARKQDSGVYICVAANIVGVRESRAARLTVLEKPVILREPEDVSVSLGESAHFFCEAKGDPMPTVEWNREQGPLPNGRYLVNPDQSLQIHYVTLQDAGRYTCTAVNDVGESKASAQLFVEGTDSSSQKDLHKELSALRISLENVTVLRSASNISQVTWKLQSSSQLHYLDGFEVLYRSLLPASSDWTAQKVAHPALHTHIGPLKRGYKYEFKVRPYGSNLYGRESNTRHLRVPETVPSAPPQDVSITMPAEHNDTAQLSWEPPPHEAHNGIIQGYQVWCVQEEEQQYLNWTVDSGTHTLDIRPLQPGRVYRIRVAAVNGAGVGAQTNPYKLLIESKQESASDHKGSLSMSDVLALMREPVFIGAVGALLWCIMMVTAACLYRKHVRPASLRGGPHKTGLYGLANEDLIIKHRMAAPDSPWMSSAWKPDLAGEQCQSQWKQNQEKPDFRRTTLPITAKTDSSVPIVPDNCGVYGTFYVDLTGNGMKTFNSPGRCTKMPHCNTQQYSTETIRISQPVAKSPITNERQVVPWKRALPSQPNMGIRKESWEKNFKRELHAVKSAPLVPIHQQALMLRNTSNIHQHRLSQTSGGMSESIKPLTSPRLLQYSASLHLVDMLPTPPPLPVDDNHSVSSEEGSSRSTKLTVDAGSLQSVCAASTGCPSQHSPSYSHLSTASFCLSNSDQDNTLSTKTHEQYLELSPNPHRLSTLSEKSSSLPRPFSPTPTFGYICGPSGREAQADVDEDRESQAIGLRRTALRATPSSCCSDWEGSLWNGWGSVSEGNTTSARTSIISSSDGSFMNDMNYARIMTMTAESMNGSLSDFSPPGSPLSMLFPPRDCFGEVDPLAVWDWSTAWVEEMEAQFRASTETPQNTRAEPPHKHTSQR